MAASAVNDGLFAAAIVLELRADDPASDVREPECKILDRDDPVHDLDPELLTESCSAIGVKVGRSERKKEGGAWRLKPGKVLGGSKGMLP